MLFEQHYLDCLSQASYVIADESTKRAVVVDPRRDVSPYLETAEEHDTHDSEDYSDADEGDADEEHELVDGVDHDAVEL